MRCKKRRTRNVHRNEIIKPTAALQWAKPKLWIERGAERWKRERERGRRWKRLLKTIFLPSRIHRTPARQSEIWKKDIALLNISYTWKVAGELKQRRWANAWDVITWIRTMLTMYLVSAMYNIKQVQITVTCWSFIPFHLLLLLLLLFCCVQNIKYRSPIVWPPAPFSQSECISFVGLLIFVFLLGFAHRDYCLLCLSVERVMRGPHLIALTIQLAIYFAPQP